jgi:hypothetical protein
MKHVHGHFQALSCSHDNCLLQCFRVLILVRFQPHSLLGRHRRDLHDDCRCSTPQRHHKHLLIAPHDVKLCTILPGFDTSENLWGKLCNSSSSKMRRVALVLNDGTDRLGYRGTSRCISIITAVFAQCKFLAVLLQNGSLDMSAAFAARSKL